VAPCGHPHQSLGETHVGLNGKKEKGPPRLVPGTAPRRLRAQCGRAGAAVVSVSERSGPCLTPNGGFERVNGRETTATVPTKPQNGLHQTSLQIALGRSRKLRYIRSQLTVPQSKEWPFR
jgi:hypothetical protein